MVGWDPRGNGRSRPPDRDFPPDFFERDAKDAVDLMKVRMQFLTQTSDLRLKWMFVFCSGFGLHQLLPAGVE